MTPQQLMDLPRAGMAEKQLRKQKDWKLSYREQLDALLDRAQCIADDIQDDASSLIDAINDIENLEEPTCA